MYINKRGVSKKANADGRPDFEKPAEWVSRYGSITFNQHGRELPLGGMNEAGLVVEALVLNETMYPPSDDRPSISILQWVQYQLDNYKTVEEVIKSDSHIRIPSPSSGPGTHYMVCERSGKCAAIEYIEGQMKYHSENTMPVKAITNSTYEESLDYRRGSWISKLKSLSFSLYRFNNVAAMVEAYAGDSAESAVSYAFDLLVEARQRLYYKTQWSIVYDVKNLKVYFRTSVNNRIRYVHLMDFDLSCPSSVMALKTRADFEGDVTGKFMPYTYEMNRELIMTVYDETPFLRTVPDSIKEARSRYPDSTVCRQ